MENKKRGAFFTPSALAKWITRRVIAESKTSMIKVLEPSSGSGVFLDSITLENISSNIDAVELDTETINESRKKYPNVNHYNCDFLQWQGKAYDLVIGNPPYISKKELNNEQTKLCRQIHVDCGLHNKEIANIWTAFVLKCTGLLKSNGILAFVLPTELLQVKYSEEIREFLISQFERIEVIVFKDLAFETLEQDTVVLIAYKQSPSKGLFFLEVDSIDVLSSNSPAFIEHHDHKKSKWTSYILSSEEMLFIDNIIKKCEVASYYCNSVAGIVTAANNFFIIPQTVINKYDLANHVVPIIQKGLFTTSFADFTQDDFNKLKAMNKPCYLLNLKGIQPELFNQGLQEYLTIGIERKIPDRYKCKLRERWFDVPSVWNSEGIFFKRSHNYPKIFSNGANAYVTDSAYRIKMHNGYNIKDFVFSFYNSLTLLCAELYGRYYGGGVLEITPNEFKQLPVPYTKANINPNCYMSDFNDEASLKNFLKDQDNKILLSIEGVEPQDIQRLQAIYEKIKNRKFSDVKKINFLLIFETLGNCSYL